MASKLATTPTTGVARTNRWFIFSRVGMLSRVTGNVNRRCVEALDWHLQTEFDGVEVEKVNRVAEGKRVPNWLKEAGQKENPSQPKNAKDRKGQ